MSQGRRLGDQRELTPEQIAKQLLRKQKKAEAEALKVAASQGSSTNVSGTSTPVLPGDNGRILVRDWVSLPVRPVVEGSDRRTLKIMTWNMLAQTLVRRDLFPSSNCLKGHQRQDMLTGEILTYMPDIACLQEVDRLDRHMPVLEAASYAYIYASGPNKSHGCVILYRRDTFRLLDQKIVYYDDENVNKYFHIPGVEPPLLPSRLASSRTTKNIGLIVSLARIDDPSIGCVIGTTHTFWHPRYPYERARQIGLLVSNVKQFRESNSQYAAWPAYIAGDFNAQPTEVSYSLLTKNPMTEAHRGSLSMSRVIHCSRDPSLPRTRDKVDDDDEGGGGEATAETNQESQVAQGYTNARPATESDGLLGDEELEELFGGRNRTALRSAYAEGLSQVESEKDNLFGVREAEATVGQTEPMWTSFTHYWRLTLDYIFILDPETPHIAGHQPKPRVEVIGLLKTHRKENLEPGLPYKGVCGSDHVALMVEVRNGG
ncbi:hypothetical protein FRC03_008770 [Tulasnella sp. 419]|nr:hypothetical protein FRC02_004464 [Tulasnella sp. 418]KAG8968071.1 hypothetical protein FRC03_008770 [Tulasnella sp. 419]